MSTDGVKADALKKPVTVTFRAEKFTIDPPDEWLFDYIHYIDREQLTLAVQAMLGADGYAKFRALRPAPRMSEIEPLMNQILTAFGLDPGELSASTGS